MANCGFVYVATGERHAAEARCAAGWLRRHGNRHPVTLFTDCPMDSRDIDDVVMIEPGLHGQLDKIRGIMLSPYKRTIFLDTDTFVLADIGELFDLLDVYDLAAAHAPRYKGFADEGVPEAFYELSTGVLGLRKTDALTAFLEDWRRDFRDGLTNDPANLLFYGDQPMFRRHAWRHRLHVCVLPPEYNYRTEFSGFLRDRAKIVHGRAADIEAVIQDLNCRPGPRFFSAFNGPGQSIDPWSSMIGGFATRGR